MTIVLQGDIIPPGEGNEPREEETKQQSSSSSSSSSKNPYGEAYAGGRAFRAGSFGEAWEVFTDYDEGIRGVGAQAGQEISDFMVKNQDDPLDVLKGKLKEFLPKRMVPYVDLADETGRAFYEEYRAASLSGSTVPSKQAPGTMNIFDQDGNIISSRAPVGLADPDDIFGYNVNRDKVGKSIVPARSWESATGGAFKGADEIARREGKWEAMNRITSKLIGYSDRRVQNVYRDVINEASEGDPYSVGWQRLAYAGCCAFCRMMAGRGAVYKSNASASFVVGRGVVRKVRGRPKQRGRKARSWERPQNREIRELYSTYHDNCQCKVIPRFTFNGAEMPLPPLMQFMQDKYQAEYYAAKESLMNPAARAKARGIKLGDVPRSWDDISSGLSSAAKRRLEEEIWGVGRKPHVYDLLGITKWEKKARAMPRVKKGMDRSPNIREILRVTRRNNMSARQRRFMPTKPHDYMVDTLAAGWKGSPYLKPQPMRFEDFLKDYGTQAWRGLKTEGGILARRKGNQYFGRVVNKQATRTQRKINRKIDQVEWLPTWGKSGAKVIVAEGRRKSTRALRYNAKQGLKYSTGQKPTGWNTEGLLRRELNESIRYHVGSTRRRANRKVDEISEEIFRGTKRASNEFTAPAYELLDKGGKKFWGWGSLFTDPVKRGIKKRERRVIRRVNRPFKRRATRFKQSYAKGGSISEAVRARTGY